MAYDIRLEGKNLIEAEKLLKNVATIFDKNNFSYTLDGGTLLGIRRENRLLPWDNDLDFCILNPDQNEVDSILKVLKKNGFRVRLRYAKKDFSPYVKKESIRMIKIRNQKFFGLIKGKVCLDIFVKYQHEGKFYWLIGDDVVKSVPEKFYADLKTIEFQNYAYPIPNLLEEYLSFRYGEWQKKDENWNTFANDKSIL